MTVLQRNHPIHVVLEKSKSVFLTSNKIHQYPSHPLTFENNQNVQIFLPECQLAHHYFLDKYIDYVHKLEI